MTNPIISHFKKVDPILYKILLDVYKIHGEELFNISKKELFFEELVESIVSQQLSIKAADTIFGRLIDILPKKKLTPENVLKLSDEKMRGVGLSYGKIKYIKDLSQKVKDKEIHLEKLDSLSNEEVIAELTKIKGIGKWTAEMFLMFSLGREDIFSHGDMGLQNAIKKLYHLEKYNPVEVEEIITKWSPYRTYAARILWRSLSLK